jgi:uncharacterized protein YcbX
LASTELRLTEIWIYPVKSLGGIRLGSSNVLGKGLEFDRRYMLMDLSGTALTQRQHPSMALFRSSLSKHDVLISYNGQSITIPLNPSSTGSTLQAKIWDDLVTVRELSPLHSEWFSVQLKFPCKLVFFPEENARPVDPHYSVNGEHVSLADAYPILVIGRSSLDDLNSRLHVPLPMNRFRPNIVFEGGDAYAEDQWKLFSIGTGKFAGIKPCARCIIPTINQDNAQKGTEPLKTLSSYRSRNNKIYFGQNVVVLAAGKISEGDIIQVSTITTQTI